MIYLQVGGFYFAPPRRLQTIYYNDDFDCLQRNSRQTEKKRFFRLTHSQVHHNTKTNLECGFELNLKIARSQV